MNKAIQDFARLDHAGSLVAPVLKEDIREQFVDAVQKAGSIEAMPEPFRSWLLDPLSIPKDALA